MLFGKSIFRWFTKKFGRTKKSTKLCGTCYFVMSDENEYKEHEYICSIKRDYVSPLDHCDDYQHYMAYADCFESPLDDLERK